MGDPQLQQFAAMHKANPYVLSLVVQEDTARKQMRMAAQAQATGGEPPKVVDQAVASIGQMPQMPMPPQGPGGPMPQGGPMPPQGAGPAPGGPAGIAALQAPNMARMADGGIAGYPDDDEVGMAEGGVARYNGATGSVTSVLDQVQAPVMQNLQDLQTQLSSTEQMLAAAAKSGDPQSLNYYAQAVQALRNQIGTITERHFGNRAPEVMRSLTAAPAAAAAPAVAQMTPQQREQFNPPMAAAQPGPGAAPAAQRKPAAGPGPAAAASAAAAPAPAMAQPTAAGAKETAAQFLDRKAIEDAVKVYGTDEAAAVNQARMRREAALANRGQALTGLEALYRKEEEGSKGEMEQAKAFALINAGLAMMAGGSPNALQNIGKGAAVGMGQYQEAIKDFKKAARERQRGIAEIENARRAEERDDVKSMLQFEERADDRMANARKFGISAIMDAGVKNAEIAARIYDTQVTQAGALQREQLGIASRERIAAADIAARKEIDRTPAEVRLMEWLRNPENKKLYESVQASKRAEDRELKLYEIYMKNKLLLGDMSFADFAAGLKDASGASGAGAGEFKVLSSRPKQ
jgi:hypothetical protein